MELPKNITQIGEADPHCKIYIEDYVISYLKQVNRKLDGKKMGLTLYGLCKEENDVRYYFFYGAAPNPFLTAETRYLSQAVIQEAEKQRKRFFTDYTFLGYIIPDGGMPESMFLYEQGIATEMSGYARFYEQNDSMLNFLLAEQKEAAESPSENLSSSKFDEVRKRREERKQQLQGDEEKTGKPKGKGTEWVMPAAACLALVLLGMNTDVGRNLADRLQQKAVNSLQQLQEKQLPVSARTGQEAMAAGKVVTEDKLTEALQKENSAYPAMSAKVEESAPATEEAESVPFEESEPSEETAAVITPSPVPEPTPTPVPESAPEVQETAAQANAAHIVKKGDTLMGISWKYYGTGEQLENICRYNNIKDPNDIKVGQKILLP